MPLRGPSTSLRNEVPTTVIAYGSASHAMRGARGVNKKKDGGMVVSFSLSLSLSHSGPIFEHVTHALAD